MEETTQKLTWKEEEKVIEKVAKDLFKTLGVSDSFSLSQTEHGAELVLDSEDNGIIIGYHGEVLESLQLVLSLMVSKKLGYFVRISIEVGEYKKNRSSWLESVALSAKERALEEGREIALPNLKSWERRVVHLFFENDPDVASESVGQGRDRMLIVKPRTA